jgi:hypothetical protein
MAGSGELFCASYTLSRSIRDAAKQDEKDKAEDEI